jgi:hypothetical protein
MFKKLLFTAAALVLGEAATAQQGFRLGITGGANISRANPIDTLPRNFSRRNKSGISAGLAWEYGLTNNSAVMGSIQIVQKGYRISNDTFSRNPYINRSITTVQIPLGISFKQRFNELNFMRENFGVAYAFRFDASDSVLRTNGTPGTFSITEKRAGSGYPMFFLGLELGGAAESKNTYSFGLNYFQTFGRDADITGRSGNRSFDMIYKGGFVNITFTYTFSLQNMKKSEEWFY